MISRSAAEGSSITAPCGSLQTQRREKPSCVVNSRSLRSSVRLPPTSKSRSSSQSVEPRSIPRSRLSGSPVKAANGGRQNGWCAKSNKLPARKVKTFPGNFSTSRPKAAAAGFARLVRPTLATAMRRTIVSWRKSRRWRSFSSWTLSVVASFAAQRGTRRNKSRSRNPEIGASAGAEMDYSNYNPIHYETDRAGTGSALEVVPPRPPGKDALRGRRTVFPGAV